MSEDKKLSGNDYLKKSNEGLNLFQKNLLNAIHAYDADGDQKSEFFALMVALEYKKFLDRMFKFLSSMGPDDDEKGDEDDDSDPLV